MIAAGDNFLTGSEFGYDSHSQSQHTEVREEIEDGYDQFLKSLEKELYGQANKTSNLTLPRKPLIPYLRFLIEYQAQKKSVITGKSPKDISNQIKALWVELPAQKKAQYIHTFEQEYSQYKILQEEFYSLTKPPKKPQSAYLIFFSSEGKNLHLSDQNRPYSEITAELSTKWKNMSPEEKLVYNNLSYERKIQYEKDLEIYRQRQEDQKFIDRYIQNKNNYELMIKQSNEQYKNPQKYEKDQKKKLQDDEEIENEKVSDSGDEYGEYSQSSNHAKRKIENILGVKVRQGIKQYLIKWIGIPNPVWTKLEDLGDEKKLIDMFEEMFVKPTESKKEQVEFSQKVEQLQNQVPPNLTNQKQIKKPVKEIKTQKITLEKEVKDWKQKRTKKSKSVSRSRSRSISKSKSVSRSRSRSISKEQAQPVNKQIKQTKKKQKQPLAAEVKVKEPQETKKVENKPQKKQNKGKQIPETLEEVDKKNETKQKLRPKRNEIQEHRTTSVIAKDDISKVVTKESHQQIPTAIKKKSSFHTKVEFNPQETQKSQKAPILKIESSILIAKVPKKQKAIKQNKSQSSKIQEVKEGVSRRTRSHINLKTEEFTPSVDDVKLETPQKFKKNKKTKKINNSRNQINQKNDKLKPRDSRKKLTGVKLETEYKTPKVSKKISKIITRSMIKTDDTKSR